MCVSICVCTYVYAGAHVCEPACERREVNFGYHSLETAQLIQEDGVSEWVTSMVISLVC